MQCVALAQAHDAICTMTSMKKQLFIDASLANALVYSNSYRTLNPSVNATGFRTSELQFRTLHQSNDPAIAEEFLINTRLRRHDWETESSIADYFTDHSITMLATRSLGDSNTEEAIGLPAPLPLRMALDEALERRRSKRLYTGDSMPLEYVATILRAAVGITGTVRPRLTSGGEATLHFRTAPSAGGLYPVDLYVIALNIIGLDRHIYKYDPHNAVLLPIGSAHNTECLLSAFAMSDDMISLSRACVVCLLIGQPWRTMRKYGARGMRFVFMETGSIAQNINLAAVALGYGSTECASLYDDEAHDALNIDGVYLTLLYFIIIGYLG
jgi:SagB-type dehydrogenase family enzyme